MISMYSACVICGCKEPLHKHHLPPKNATKYGYSGKTYIITLCPNHHELYRKGKLSDIDWNKIKQHILTKYTKKLPENLREKLDMITLRSVGTTTGLQEKEITEAVAFAKAFSSGPTIQWANNEAKRRLMAKYKKVHLKGHWNEIRKLGREIYKTEIKKFIAKINVRGD